MVNNRVAYGLAKKYGIDTKGMSPEEVWEALKKKGINNDDVSDGAYDSKNDLGELKKRVTTKVPQKATGFASKERLYTKHHVAHAKEMGFKNQKEYEKAACEFFNEGKGDMFYNKARDRFYKYDGENLLCVSSYGVIHTFMTVSNKKFKKIEKQEKLWKIE